MTALHAAADEDQAGGGRVFVADFDSLKSAIAEAGGGPARVVLAATVSLEADLVVPENITLEVTASGRVIVPTGCRFILRAPPVAGPHCWLVNALPGKGAVQFPHTAEAYPDWWIENTKPGETDMSEAIQAAVACGAGRVRFLGQVYRNTRVTEITASNIELVGHEQTVIHTVREVPMNSSTVDERVPSSHIKKSFAFEISGAVDQSSVTIRDLTFTGGGYWGGIYSSLLYPYDGWGPDGYPNVDLLAYRTTRTDCRFANLVFTAPYYEAMALTCVSATVEDIVVTAGRNSRNHGNIVVRYTNSAVISRVTFNRCRYKNINTSYVDGLTISDVTICEAHGGADGVGVYIGHFVRNATLSRYEFRSLAPFEEFIKISYFASDVTVRDCTLDGTGYVMIQAGQRVVLERVNVTTSGGRALQLTDYSGPPSPPLRPVDVRVVRCRFISTAHCGGERKVVDLSHGAGTTFEDNEVIGNIWANPAPGMRLVRNTVVFAPSGPSYATAAVYLQDFREGGLVVLENNRIQAGTGVYAVYLNGSRGAANLEIVANQFDYPRREGYGVVANYITGGRFRYVGNRAPDQDANAVLYVNYEDTRDVVVK